MVYRYNTGKWGIYNTVLKCLTIYWENWYLDPNSSLPFLLRLKGQTPLKSSIGDGACSLLTLTSAKCWEKHLGCLITGLQHLKVEAQPLSRGNESKSVMWFAEETQPHLYPWPLPAVQVTRNSFTDASAQCCVSYFITPLCDGTGVHLFPRKYHP